MGHYDRRSRLTRNEVEREWNDLAEENGRIGQIRLADQNQHAFLKPVKLNRPRFTIDEEEFLHPDLGVEIKLLARELMSANEFRR